MQVVNTSDAAVRIMHTRLVRPIGVANVVLHTDTSFIADCGDPLARADVPPHSSPGSPRAHHRAKGACEAGRETSCRG
jgi:hypothetical protein